MSEYCDMGSFMDSASLVFISDSLRMKINPEAICWQFYLHSNHPYQSLQFHVGMPQIRRISNKQLDKSCDIKAGSLGK